MPVFFRNFHIRNGKGAARLSNYAVGILWMWLSSFLLVAAEPPLPVVNVWSGRSQRLPYEAVAEWRLEAEHGRLIGGMRSSGAVSLSLPPLTGTEQAVLVVDGQRRAAVRIHPPALLAGLAADVRCRQREFAALGLANRPEAAAVITDETDALARWEKRQTAGKLLLLTSRWDFPLSFSSHWTKITLFSAAGGPFSLLWEKSGRILDTTGGGVDAILLEDAIGKSVLILPPAFDLKDIDNSLLIQKELQR